MNPLDPHTLFSIFEQGDEQIYKEHGVSDTLDNPFVLMGMVVRGVENYLLMNTIYNRRYPEEYKKVSRVIKFKYLNKLFGYLLRIEKIKDVDRYSVGTSFNFDDAIGSLGFLLKYYEKIEHYEKCAVIKKYMDKLEYTEQKLY